MPNGNSNALLCARRSLKSSLDQCGALIGMILVRGGSDGTQINLTCPLTNSEWFRPVLTISDRLSQTQKFEAMNRGKNSTTNTGQTPIHPVDRVRTPKNAENVASRFCFLCDLPCSVAQRRLRALRQLRTLTNTQERERTPRKSRNRYPRGLTNDDSTSLRTL